MFILPINKDNPVKNLPWVVFSLIIANTVVLIITYGVFSSQEVFNQYGFVPARPQAGALFSSMFLHAGFWHLLGNMWFLWMFGNRVENMFRPFLFVLVYVGCGLGGHYLHYVFNPSSSIPCVGASGAISGIVGSYLVLFPKSKFDLVIYFRWSALKTIPTRAPVAVGAWIAEQTILGIITQLVHVSSVAFWAHIGGFATGVVTAFLFTLVVPQKKRRSLERTKPWFMQERFNKDDDHFTQLKI